MKIPEISYDTQYDDDTEGNILHELAAHKFTPFFYRKYYMGKNYNEEANQRDFMNNSRRCKFFSVKSLSLWQNTFAS